MADTTATITKLPQTGSSLRHVLLPQTQLLSTWMTSLRDEKTDNKRFVEVTQKVAAQLMVQGEESLYHTHTGCLANVSVHSLGVRSHHGTGDLDSNVSPLPRMHLHAEALWCEHLESWGFTGGRLASRIRVGQASDWIPSGLGH